MIQLSNQSRVHGMTITYEFLSRVGENVSFSQRLRFKNNSEFIGNRLTVLKKLYELLLLWLDKSIEMMSLGSTLHVVE